MSQLLKHESSRGKSIPVLKFQLASSHSIVAYEKLKLINTIESCHVDEPQGKCDFIAGKNHMEHVDLRMKIHRVGF